LNLLAPLYRFADRLRYREHDDLGQHGEDLAHRHLRREGFIVAARNWRPPQGGGEIDIIAWDRQILVFTEVKTRTCGEWGVPERAIDQSKMLALRRAARDYMRRSGIEPGQVRFDAIMITPDSLRHLRDVFSIDPPYSGF
jgi:putative endonuclease